MTESLKTYLLNFTFIFSHNDIYFRIYCFVFSKKFFFCRKRRFKTIDVRQIRRKERTDEILLPDVEHKS